ncbi:hypothetical protein [Actinacidiphila yanglinensis]|uniref:hypothetical protein n=1 Tax=Actinacidiphila yanglinensis TaxID=310779 RepID=UPI001356B497|nr:hypothetical protein [Actinacidiphila yanglinensis]
MPALAAFLRRHLGWLAVHPAAEDAATDIDAVLYEALRITSPEPCGAVPSGLGAH